MSLIGAPKVRKSQWRRQRRQKSERRAQALHIGLTAKFVRKASRAAIQDEDTEAAAAAEAAEADLGQARLLRDNLTGDADPGVREAQTIAQRHYDTRLGVAHSSRAWKSIPIEGARSGRIKNGDTRTLSMHIGLVSK
jgi:hypothetical protein